MTTTAAPPTAAEVPSDSRNWATFAQLSALAPIVGLPPIVGPLVFWLIKRDTDRFVAEHAREALNFNLSLLIYVAIGLVGSILTLGLGLLAFVPALILAVPFWLTVTIIAAIRASGGEHYRYPLSLRLIS